MSQTSDDAVVAMGTSPEPQRSGPVAELALVTAGLGMVIYLLGFVADFGLGSLLLGPLLVGGGLLAGTAVLPGVGNRMLVPATVAVVTGALLLLQVVVVGTDSAVVVGALVLALLEAAVAIGAVLLHLGALPARMPSRLPAKLPTRLSKLRRRRGSAADQPPLYPGYPQRLSPSGFPEQQYPGQAYPGQQPGAYPGLFDRPPGDLYAGEHSSAQNARYRPQYGVPGYPPPPYGSEPGGYAGGSPGFGRVDTPAPDPTADPVTVVVPPSRPADGAPTPPAAAPPVVPSVPVSSSPSSSSPPASEAGERPGDGAGAHRAADPPSPPASGSHRVVPSTSDADAGAGAADDDGQDQTRVLPTVSPERPPS